MDQFVSSIQFQIFLAGLIVSWMIWVTVTLFRGQEKMSVIKTTLDDVKLIVSQLIAPVKK